MRLGDQGAGQAVESYLAAMADLGRANLPAPLKSAEARRQAERFLAANAGTIEAREILFWPQLTSAGGATIVKACRKRLDAVIEAVRAPD